jgi:hypothetical protein
MVGEAKRLVHASSLAPSRDALFVVVHPCSIASQRPDVKQIQAGSLRELIEINTETGIASRASVGDNSLLTKVCQIRMT